VCLPLPAHTPTILTPPPPPPPSPFPDRTTPVPFQGCCRLDFAGSLTHVQSHSPLRHPPSATPPPPHPHHHYFNTPVPLPNRFRGLSGGHDITGSLKTVQSAWLKPTVLFTRVEKVGISSESSLDTVQHIQQCRACQCWCAGECAFSVAEASNCAVSPALTLTKVARVPGPHMASKVPALQVFWPCWALPQTALHLPLLVKQKVPFV
jgi:hypothetical protein